MERYPWQRPEQNMAEEEGSGNNIASAVGKAVRIAAVVGTAAYGLASLFASRLEDPAETSRKTAKAHESNPKPKGRGGIGGEGGFLGGGEISGGGGRGSGGVGGRSLPEPDWNLSAPKKERWQPPEQPWYKLNTDGTSQRKAGLSGAGGLIRDHNGEYQLGFSVKLELCDPSEAEWWGAYHGLSLAWDRGFKRIILEIDNQGVACEINKIIEKNDFNLNAHRADTPKDKIKRLLGKDWEVEVIWQPWPTNKCADRLAAMAVEKNMPLEQPLVMEQPPDDQRFLEVLSQDRNGALRRE